MNRQDVADYYSNERICGELLKNAKNREVAGALWDGRYDQRPNILQFPSDVAQMVRKGVTSFHYSVEHWSNPMALSSDNYERLRTGWDMLIDIDSKLGIEESKLAAGMICQLLRKYGMRNFGLKFSGRRGFHICMPWIMFPKEIDYKPLEKQYPDVPRIIAGFIRSKIREDLLAALVKTKGAKNLVEILGESPNELDPFYFVEVEKDWGNRHMFRAPYSFNEKTWLVSVPIEQKELQSFDLKNAEFGKVLSEKHPEFFRGESGEATDLITEAIDWHAAQKKEVKVEKKRLVTFDRKISEEHFPPCVKAMLGGLGDGKKRSLFTLINFLKMMNWTRDEIAAKVLEWNAKNRPPLPQSIVLGQLRYAERRETAPPANCTNAAYYIDIGLCRPDAVCTRGGSGITIKNPIAYPFRIMKRTRKEKPKQRGFSCLCGKEFPTELSLAMHKGKMH
ncbi:MAG TPA: hypothetical protein VJI12_03740 [archaeon]|nr:hypothetical protein [archaeon]